MRVNPELLRRGYLKKQTQFVPTEIGAKSYMKGDYEEFHASKAAKKQSQFKANFPTFGRKSEATNGQIVNKLGGSLIPIVFYRDGDGFSLAKHVPCVVRV